MNPFCDGDKFEQLSIVGFQYLQFIGSFHFSAELDAAILFPSIGDDLTDLGMVHWSELDAGVGGGKFKIHWKLTG